MQYSKLKEIYTDCQILFIFIGILHICVFMIGGLMKVIKNTLYDRDNTCVTEIRLEKLYFPLLSIAN